MNSLAQRLISFSKANSKNWAAFHMSKPNLKFKLYLALNFHPEALGKAIREGTSSKKYVLAPGK
jgi:hypothetical protein